MNARLEPFQPGAHYLFDTSAALFLAEGNLLENVRAVLPSGRVHATATVLSEIQRYVTHNNFSGNNREKVLQLLKWLGRPVLESRLVAPQTGGLQGLMNNGKPSLQPHQLAKMTPEKSATKRRRAAQANLGEASVIATAEHRGWIAVIDDRGGVTVASKTVLVIGTWEILRYVAQMTGTVNEMFEAIENLRQNYHTTSTILGTGTFEEFAAPLESGHNQPRHSVRSLLKSSAAIRPSNTFELRLQISEEQLEPMYSRNLVMTVGALRSLSGLHDVVTEELKEVIVPSVVRLAAQNLAGIDSKDAVEIANIGHRVLLPAQWINSHIDRDGDPTRSLVRNTEVELIEQPASRLLPRMQTSADAAAIILAEERDKTLVVADADAEMFREATAVSIITASELIRAMARGADSQKPYQSVLIKLNGGTQDLSPHEARGLQNRCHTDLSKGPAFEPPMSLIISGQTVSVSTVGQGLSASQ